MENQTKILVPTKIQFSEQHADSRAIWEKDMLTWRRAFYRAAMFYQILFDREVLEDYMRLYGHTYQQIMEGLQNERTQP